MIYACNEQWVTPKYLTTYSNETSCTHTVQQDAFACISQASYVSLLFTSQAYSPTNSLLHLEPFLVVQSRMKN